jgi:energy-coupling factor transporter ATP-binding protein EcfA2
MMNSSLIEKLTHEYKRAVEKEWSFLYANDTELRLQNSVVMLQELSKSQELSNSSNKAQETLYDLSSVLYENNHLVFLGEPGSGKSTTLQFIGLCFTHENWQKTKINAKKEYIPIKISLQEFAPILSEPGPTMERVLGLVVREYLRSLSEQQAYELIGEWLKVGDLLLLLDGLDEVPDRIRSGVREEIYRFTSSLQSTRSQVIVSSRLAGYSTFGSSLFKEYKLKPFIHTEDISDFLRSWMMALRPDWNNEKAGTEADNLIKQMKLNRALNNVIDNPLVLRISAQVYTNRGEIAKNRSGLYQLFIKDLWERAVHRGANSNIENEVLSNCEILAWQLHTRKAPDIQFDILKVISEKMGLVVQVGDNITFSHTTLQEYFVGRRLVRAWQKNRGLTWAFLRPRLHMPEWREPILLMGGSLNKADGSYLSRKIYYANSAGERRYHRDKTLIASLAGEDVFVNQRVINKILRKVRLINTKWGKLIMREQGSRERVDLIKALGNFGKSAIPTLIDFPKNEDDDLVFITTLRTLEELNAVEAAPVILELYNNTGYYFTKANLLFALGSLKVKKAIPEMIQAIESGDDYWGTMGAHALARMKAIETIPILIKLLGHQKWEVRESAAEALGWMKHIALPAIRQALKNNDSQIRHAAVRALREASLKEVIPDLHIALQDQDEDVQYQAISALAVCRRGV